MTDDEIQELYGIAAERAYSVISKLEGELALFVATATCHGIAGRIMDIGGLEAALLLLKDVEESLSAMHKARLN